MEWAVISIYLLIKLVATVDDPVLNGCMDLGFRCLRIGENFCLIEKRPNDFRLKPSSHLAMHK